MPNKNWFDKLFNNNHWDYAYAYAYVETPVEEKKEEKEEEVNLLPTVFGFFWIAASIAAAAAARARRRAAERRAAEALRREIQEQERVQKEHDVAFETLEREREERVRLRDEEVARQDADIAAARGKAAEARELLATTTKEGKEAVGYATRQREVQESKLVSQKAERDRVLARKKLDTDVKPGSRPGIGTTIVKSPEQLGGLGKPGSAKGKTPGPKDKAGKLLIG